MKWTEANPDVGMRLKQISKLESETQHDAMTQTNSPKGRILPFDIRKSSSEGTFSPGWKSDAMFNFHQRTYFTFPSEMKPLYIFLSSKYVALHPSFPSFASDLVVSTIVFTLSQDPDHVLVSGLDVVYSVAATKTLAKPLGATALTLRMVPGT